MDIHNSPMHFDSQNDEHSAQPFETGLCSADATSPSLEIGPRSILEPERASSFKEIIFDSKGMASVEVVANIVNHHLPSRETAVCK